MKRPSNVINVKLQVTNSAIDSKWLVKQNAITRKRELLLVADEGLRIYWTNTIYTRGGEYLAYVH